MPRINISVDLKSNEILLQEIDKAIEASIKSKTREYFHQTLEEELTRIADKTTEKWEYRGACNSNPSRLDTALKEQIDGQITEQIGKIEVSNYDLQKIIDEKLKKIDEIIGYYVTKKLERLSFEDYIAELVGKEVQKVLPAKVLELLVRGVSATSEN